MDDLVAPPGDTGVAAVMLKVRTDRPTINAGRGLSAVLARFLVDDHVSA